MELNKYFSIAIDGPAGSGKSTIAKIFAEKCKDFTYINTGSMFRAVAYFCLINNIDINNEKELLNKINSIHIELENNLVFINDGKAKQEVSAFIRNPDIDKLTSEISKIKIIRDKLLKDQVNLSNKSNVIMDGRDIGTVVLPNASLKIFLTADIDIRAKRRYDQLKQNNDVEITLEEIKKEIQKRDNEDYKREISPLIRPKDAILIDSTKYSIDEILFIIQKEYLIRNKQKTIGSLKKINKNVNNLISDFIDIYNDIFVKKDLLTYDEIIDLDYKIYDVHNLFVDYLESFSFLKEKLSPKVLQLYLEVVNEVKLPIHDFMESKNFDLLYFSHLLVKIYILLPYVFYAIGLFIYKPNLSKNETRHKHLVKTLFVSKYINRNCSLFKKIDDLDLKISNLIEENNEKHTQMKHTYSLTHNKFNKLFNQFILVQEYEIKEANVAIKISIFFHYWYCFLISLILLIIILLVIIILTVK